MAVKRLIVEMGQGVDLHGQDYTKAAERAIEDAIRHSCIPMFGTLGIPSEEMRVSVTIGVQKPEEVDCAALAEVLPRGKATVKAVFGGMDVTNPDNGTVNVIATAAVEAFLPKQG